MTVKARPWRSVSQSMAGAAPSGHRREDGGVGVAVRLLLDVGGEGRHAVGDAGGALGGGAGRGDEAGRERRGALGQRIALEDDGRDAGFLRGEGGTETRRPAADDGDRDGQVEGQVVGQDAGHADLFRHRSEGCLKPLTLPSPRTRGEGATAL